MDRLKKYVGWIIAAGFLGLIFLGIVVNVKIVRELNDPQQSGTVSAPKQVLPQVRQRPSVQISDSSFPERARLHQTEVTQSAQPQAVTQSNAGSGHLVSGPSPILVN